jgi:hypothetical protein
MVRKATASLTLAGLGERSPWPSGGSSHQTRRVRDCVYPLRTIRWQRVDCWSSLIGRGRPAHAVVLGMPE